MTKPNPIGKPTRHAAGNDPIKRSQIMAGAKQAFMECGFDATGVNDICRIAGISKSTLYVYFDSKEDLFEALVEAERERLFQGIAEALTSHALPQDALVTFGLKLAEIICSPEVIQAQRIMIGIAGRMPELGARFYSGGAMRTQKDLAKFLNQNVAMGRLTIPDPPLAAAQFIELCIAPLWKPRIFGKEALPPLRHDLENAVNSAVSMFLAAYGRPTTAA